MRGMSSKVPGISREHESFPAISHHFQFHPDFSTFEDARLCIKRGRVLPWRHTPHPFPSKQSKHIPYTQTLPNNRVIANNLNSNNPNNYNKQSHTQNVQHLESNV
jgi:hypothetical protein